jgi:hypothetical protein
VGIAALAISKGCGKREREDSLIVLPSTLSIRPAFPPLFFWKKPVEKSIATAFCNLLKCED